MKPLTMTTFLSNRVLVFLILIKIGLIYFGTFALLFLSASSLEVERTPVDRAGLQENNNVSVVQIEMGEGYSEDMTDPTGPDQ